MGLQSRLSLAQLYVFADAHRVRDLGGFVEAVVLGGADVVQVRLRGLTRSKREQQFESVRARCRGTQVIVVVDDDLDVAATAQADALLLDGDGVAKARTRLSRYALVGQEVGDVDALHAARAQQADFAIVRPASHRDDVQAAYAAAAKAAPPHHPASLRWFADGGISPDNVGAVLASGARRIAVGTALLQAPDPQHVAKRLAYAVACAWDADPAMQAIRDAAFGHSPRATLKQTDQLGREGLLPPERDGE